MNSKYLFHIYCFCVGFLGLFTRFFTNDLDIVNGIMFMLGNLLLIAGIYYWCYLTFKNELHYKFSLRIFLKKGLQISGYVGIFTAIAIYLQIKIFGNEVLVESLAKIEIDKMKYGSIEKFENAKTSVEWWCRSWVLSLKQILRILFFGSFYSLIVAALFRLHPDRVKEKK